MNLSSNMEFEIKGNFMPNLHNSERLKILEVSPESVVIQMQNSNSRGVFPLDNFQYWIRKNSLIYISDHDERMNGTEN
ncbi:hypothetical protein M670_03642 [Schinkia azotoformans MEV2011]|uniref:Uncharacterized protein n=2 Tax=Schinkia azotoformans TaxID=1454 RepID=K6D2Z3_SCHAZ|nr:hypothetical protein [Schinkia azotoformans]EKN66867.1 hypothetical protein BAZO_10702 [Schinkia azotoformans LMG 9581]KEF37051.1 hypothetical protein M670_03642 [Schinkia azotoformans MEV2011]MEC1639511.1 hypothetical protein [Schinkia azotoformans]MEC1697674.1 hypothetical protein [Schinkia azotoformans]MEC1718585.1 hypothetical protein [Schinkia azotoformans]